ncbi:MAG: sialidase family protein [Candidatus Poribacteria bacterium]
MTTDYVGDVRDTRVVCALPTPGPYDKIWIPFIERWREDHLIVAFGLHLDEKTDMGDIVCCRSADDGDTWSEPTTIFDHRDAHGSLRFAYANPVLYHPPGQDVVWCFAMRCSLHFPDSEDSRLCAAYSSDGGWSWQPVELSVHHASPLITCAGIHRIGTGDDARYLMPVHRNTKRRDPMGDRHHFVLESTNLLEWKLAGYVTQPTDGEVFMHEGGIAEGDREGELKIVMRTATWAVGGQPLDPPIAYSSVSKDGREWSPGVPEPSLHNSVSKAYFGKTGNGAHVYVYSDGPAWERKALWYRVRQPGQEWGDSRTFFDAGCKNSYPTLLERDPGEYYAVWDSSDSPTQSRSLIRFGKITID